MKSPNQHFLYGSIVVIVTGVIGILGYSIAGWPFIDAIYMVVITIFGVGYGEVKELDPELKIFTILFIMTGCTGLIYTVGAFINWLTEGQLQQLLGKRKMDKEISNLSNHIVICGYGRMGRLLAKKLKAAKKQFLIIDSSDKRIALIHEMGYLFIQGDATEEATLNKAMIAQAAVVATVLPNDAANVFIVLSCRALNPDLTIVSRANQISSEAKLKQAGVDKVIMPAAIGADRVANMLLKPSASEVIERDLKDSGFADELHELGLELEEIPTPNRLPDNCSLQDIETGENASFIVVAVRKTDGNTILKPQPSTRLEAGDVLVVMNHVGVIPKLTFRKRKSRDGMQYRGTNLQK